MTEGVFRHRDIKFYYARVLLPPHIRSAPSSRRKASFDLREHCGRTPEITHLIVGVGALDDPEKQSIIAIQTSSPLCALKPFSMKVFGATFFQKSGIKNTSTYHSTNTERTMCAKNISV